MNDRVSVADGLPDQQFRIFVSIACADRIAVGQEFMGGFDLLADQVEKRVPPADGAYYFKCEEVGAMVLADMVELVPENLPACRTVDVQVVVPEDPVEKGERRSGLRGHKDPEIPDLLPGAAGG